MDKVSLFLLIGLFLWLVGVMVGQDQNTLIGETEPSAIELIMGMIAAAVSCQLFLNRSLTR